MAGFGAAGKEVKNFGGGNWDTRTSIGPSTDIGFGSPGAFSAAAKTNATDYDKIMGAYDSLLKTNKENPLKFNPITPQLAEYKPGADFTSSMSNLSGLASTGGYSAADIGNIRARSISPIRSIYANAQQNLNRQKSLQGGYSPNYTAASAKMARELSEQIGQRSTDVEAGIAQNVAQNKLTIAPTYSAAAAEGDRARMAIEKSNTDTVNQINELNARLGLQAGQQNNQNILQAIEGMKGLYGTSPALVSTFGNQVAQAGQLAQGQQQMNLYRQQIPYGMVQSLLSNSGA